MDTPEVEPAIFVVYQKSRRAGNIKLNRAFDDYHDAEAYARQCMNRNGLITGVRMVLISEQHDVELAFPEYTRTDV